MNFKSLVRNQYLKNIFTVLSGTVISQVLMVFAMPIIARLYSPSEFGDYVFFTGIMGVVGIIVTLQYELAIILPKKVADSKNIFWLSIIISFFISFLMFLILLIIHYLGFYQKYLYFLWIIPIALFMTGILQSANAFNIKLKKYKVLSISKLFQTIITLSSQFILKFFFMSSSWGLVMGNVLGIVGSVVFILLSTIKNGVFSFSDVSKKNIITLAHKYDSFPKYQSINVLLNAITFHLPAILLPILFSSEIAGYFGLTQRILAIPVSLLAMSTRRVYMQKASEMYANKKSIVQLYKNTTFGLLKIGTIFFVVIFIFSDWIFEYGFGLEWVDSSIYAKVAVLFYLTLFIKPTTDANVTIFQYQKKDLLFKITQLLIGVIILYLCSWFYISPVIGIGFYLFSGAIVNIISISFFYKKIPNEF